MTKFEVTICCVLLLQWWGLQLLLLPVLTSLVLRLLVKVDTVVLLVLVVLKGATQAVDLLQAIGLLF